ncbi:MAG: phosphatidylserine decarboxylase family protein [Thermodesulfobacteriota bacterium]|jgi:phosphatidylserine decarboxylase
MHFAREGYPRILGLGILSFLCGLLGFELVGLLLLLLTLFVAFFFRDPERHGPRDDRLILSPADGRVVTVEKNIHEERFLAAPSTRVGIFMSPLDVHVNRIPVSGRVAAVHYQSGQFRPAFAADATEVNERNAVTIQDRQGRRVLLVQVAGILARRIVCSLKGGEQVSQGDRYGLIMLGSRVDLYCPPEVRLRVEVGQRVKAGETVIGEYP